MLRIFIFINKLIFKKIAGCLQIEKSNGTLDFDKENFDNNFAGEID